MKYLKSIAQIASLTAFLSVFPLASIQPVKSKKPLSFDPRREHRLNKLVETFKGLSLKGNKAHASSDSGMLVIAAIDNMKMMSDPLANAETCEGGVVAGLLCAMNTIMVHAPVDSVGTVTATTDAGDTLILSKSADPTYDYDFNISTGGAKHFNMSFTKDGKVGFADQVNQTPVSPFQLTANRITWDSTNPNAAVVVWSYQSQSNTTRSWTNLVHAGKFVGTVNTLTNTARIQGVEYTPSIDLVTKYAIARNGSHSVATLDTSKSDGSNKATTSYECYRNDDAGLVVSQTVLADLSGSAQCGFATSFDFTQMTSNGGESDLGLLSASGGAPFSLK